MKARVFILWFLFAVIPGFFTAASAQLDISGRVVDKDSKEVLNGVVIQVQNSLVKTVSDNSGFFRLSDSIGLPCTLEYSLDKYEPAEFVVLKNKQELELELKKIVVRTENIQVIDEPKSQNISDKSSVKLDVQGQVLDQLSNEVLTGVNITVKNKTIGTASDADGFFHLKSEITLPCVLRISMIGYGTQEMELTQNHKNLSFYLSYETILSGEVTVKAKGIEVEEKNFRQIISMETMDALTIRETPAANFYEAVGHLKGIDVVMQSLNFMTVNARGFNSTENTRLVQVVDGMDNMAPGMNFPIGNIAGVSELDVEALEFIPGPAEVKYGGNALNGVLIMTSKDPFKYQGVSLLVKPGVSDIVPGSDHPFQFSAKPQLETGIRIAKAFNNKFAFKLNASYSTGRDWYANDTTNIRPGNIKWEPDPGHDAVNKYGDEVTADLQLERFGGTTIVSRTGYLDQDLVNNKVENLKLSGALHYKLNNTTTAILHGNYGKASTVYTGDNRTSLTGFQIYQGKAEIIGEHFLLRGYASVQDAGTSYDAKFLAVHLNNEARSDEQWFRDYYYAYRGAYRALGVLSGNHQDAREFADRYRLMPGTPEFEAAKQKIINNPDFKKGASIYNSSGMYHFDAIADLNKYVSFADISVGGSYRFYDLNSQGTIFPDSLGNDITIYEFGGFVEAKQNFLDEKLEVKGSVRFDKNENFEGHFSPRISALYLINEKNNFRVSVLTGFRNPSVKEQFINKDLGTARYLGGLEPIYQPYDIAENSIYLSAVNKYNEAVKADMSGTGSEYGLNQAMLNHLDILEGGIVQPDALAPIKAEQVFTFEVGYKTNIADVLFFDAVYYNSAYQNFIGIAKVVKPRTSPQVDMYTAASQINKSAQNDVYYLNVNSHENIGIQGVSFGYKWLMPMGSIISGNMTWSDVRSDISDPVAPGFNTPGFKSNLSLQNRRMDRMENNPGFRNIGFKVTWRYQSRYYWESTFGDGWIKPVSTLDLQFSVNMENPKSILKFGASNFFNNRYAYSFGGSSVGVMFYVSYVIDNIFNL
ncbi:TonB-dependent receptor domain-containing protein [uncultured Draconibacterium sp.]|uniref:TonB-dependent receptor domain-containing protein n=1 Tax=uncultured Draconibacterium sp. TaxID=1573823 RepID=UPI0032166391